MNALVHGSVQVETERGRCRYDRMIFGQFLEHFHRQVYGGVFEPGSPLADERGFRLDVVAALRELQVPIVRWPGGCFASTYHWKDGVGPERRPAYDKAWRVEEPNTFGTDEFVTWCRMIGAEPYVCTNAGTGTPEKMSDWVEYGNLDGLGHWARMRCDNGFPEPHNVRYWSIGNENYGGWEIGAKTADEWPRLVVESAKMMKRVDPSIKLLVAALPDPGWTLPLLRAAGHLLDFVSIHDYWDPLGTENNPSDYATCVLRSGRPEDSIRRTERIIAEAGLEGKVGIAFDEWNLRGWHHPWGNTPEDIAARDKNDINATYTMADAVFAAGFLNTCLRHAGTVRMACMAPVINTRGPLFVHPEGIVRRTTFHVMAMYANRLAENVAPAQVTGDPFARGDESVPALDAVATCDDAMSHWRLVLINRDPESELRCSVSLGGEPLDGTHQVTVLAGGSPDAFNDVDQPDRVIPEQTELRFSDGAAPLPPHSISIVEVS